MTTVENDTKGGIEQLFERVAHEIGNARRDPIKFLIENEGVHKSVVVLGAATGFCAGLYLDATWMHTLFQIMTAPTFDDIRASRSDAVFANLGIGFASGTMGGAIGYAGAKENNANPRNKKHSVLVNTTLMALSFGAAGLASPWAAIATFGGAVGGAAGLIVGYVAQKIVNAVSRPRAMTLG